MPCSLVPTTLLFFPTICGLGARKRNICCSGGLNGNWVCVRCACSFSIPAPATRWKLSCLQLTGRDAVQSEHIYVVYSSASNWIRSEILLKCDWDQLELALCQRQWRNGWHSLIHVVYWHFSLIYAIACVACRSTWSDILSMVELIVRNRRNDNANGWRLEAKCKFYYVLRSTTLSRYTVTNRNDIILYWCCSRCRSVATQSQQFVIRFPLHRENKMSQTALAMLFSTFGEREWSKKLHVPRQLPCAASYIRGYSFDIIEWREATQIWEFGVWFFRSCCYFSIVENKFIRPKSVGKSDQHRRRWTCVEIFVRDADTKIEIQKRHFNKNSHHTSTRIINRKFSKFLVLHSTLATLERSRAKTENWESKRIQYVFLFTLEIRRNPSFVVCVCVECSTWML